LSDIKQHFKTVAWVDGAVELLDQRLLPGEEKYKRYTTAAGMADAVSTMVVRGAPAIGIAAAFGVVLASAESGGSVDKILKSCDLLTASRPTAVNLFWAVNRMKECMKKSGLTGEELTGVLLKEAEDILSEDIASCKAMGDAGAAFIKDGATVLTHCNAGALATGGWGTALGVIRSAVAGGKNIKVIADETRPRLQGAGLTAWELQRDNIDVTVIPDNAAASLMLQKKIDCVVVGADRIAANGDVCNKIGTYSVALAAKAAGVPFYVAAPVSTIDMSCKTGADIPIEQRSSKEVTHVQGRMILPAGIPVLNPAFDVTPNSLVTAVFTEYGVFDGNFKENLKRIIR
jgi:methylthioribose-1-phosphate isomerase